MARSSNGWHPEGFDRYRELYPATPALAPEPDREPTARFAASWHAGPAAAAEAISGRAASTTVVFVRGYLGHYMPGNLSAAAAALRRLGFDAFIASNRSGGTVGGNARLLLRQLGRRPLRERLVFCGHSRGAVECLAALSSDRASAARCDGVAASQAPHRGSRLIESVLLGRHRGERFGARRRAAERVQRAALACLRAREGGYELTGERWAGVVAPLAGHAFPFPVLQTASWSSRPTAWLDSFHGRLGEIGPARAHDGQFFLEDLIWPGWPHVLLPDLDHAQPAVGGHGFDPARYWLAVLAVLLERGGGERTGAARGAAA